MFKKIILALCLLTFVGCSFSKDDGKVRQKEVDDRLNQLAIYKKVVGKYDGTLTTSAGAEKVELDLFTLEEEAGTNVDGSKIYNIILHGSYKRVSPLQPGYKFTARYIPETAELILANDLSKKGAAATDKPGILATATSAASTEGHVAKKTDFAEATDANYVTKLGPDDIYSVTAIANGSTIVGDAKSSAGILGKLNLKLSADQSDVGSGNKEHEYYESIYKEYLQIAGTYKGPNIVDGKTANMWTLTFDVYKQGDIPFLIGSLLRSDDPTGSVALDLNLTYQPELSPPELNMVGLSRFMPTSTYRANFQGKLTDDTYDGAWYDNRAAKGTFKLIKEKK